MTSVCTSADKWGVSVIVCCHNGAKRLGPTLAHLAAQRGPAGLPWEVLVVDNASTDGTAAVARAAWPADAPGPLRIIVEPQLGSGPARERGMREARYELVSWVDDDNWVCPDWVRLVAEIMATHPEVGACGSLSEGVPEISPLWLGRFIRSYAVGPQADRAMDITETRGYLWGAGLTLRRTAWRSLIERGFCSHLAGRQGASLASGEDVELCLALRLAGWRVWYDPRLTLRHCLPASRLKWSYLRRLHRAFGAADVGLLPYIYALEGRPNSPKQHLKRLWQLQLLVSLIRVMKYGLPLLRLIISSSSEGNARILKLERELGRLLEVVREREILTARIRDTQVAPWWNEFGRTTRRTDPPATSTP